MNDELDWENRSDEWKAGWHAGQSGEDIGMSEEVFDSKSDEWKQGLKYAIQHPQGGCYVPMGEREYEINGIYVDKDFIRIEWQGKEGFGMYDISFEDGKIYGYSEYMDKRNDKTLLRALLNAFADKVKVVE